MMKTLINLPGQEPEQAFYIFKKVTDTG